MFKCKNCGAEYVLKASLRDHRCPEAVTSDDVSSTYALIDSSDSSVAVITDWGTGNSTSDNTSSSDYTGGGGDFGGGGSSGEW